jgi:hypothetical protein
LARACDRGTIRRAFDRGLESTEPS